MEETMKTPCSTKMLMQRVDVFPNSVSSEVEKLHYPKRGYLSEIDVYFFICYLHLSSRIYFRMVDREDRFVSPYLYKNIKKYQPDLNFKEKNNWCAAASKLRKAATNVHSPVNTNQLLCMKFEKNKYIVKTYFTFGQRFVEENRAHIIQLLNVPILFYFLSSPRKTQSTTIRSKIFKSKEQHHYSLKWLQPNTNYRIPPNTTYILLAIHHCLFQLDIVDKSTVPPFVCLDPCVAKQKTLDPLYSRPIQTPFIEDAERICEHLEESMPPPIEMSPAKLMPPPPTPTSSMPTRSPMDTSLQSPTLPMPSSPMDTLVEESALQSSPPQVEPSMDTSFQESSPQVESLPTPTVQAEPIPAYHIIMSSFPVEKEIHITPPNLIQWYQNLKYKELLKPEIQGTVLPKHLGGQDEPLDLTFMSIDDLITFPLSVDNEKFNNVVKDLEDISE